MFQLFIFVLRLSVKFIAEEPGPCSIFCFFLFLHILTHLLRGDLWDEHAGEINSHLATLDIRGRIELYEVWSSLSSVLRSAKRKRGELRMQIRDQVLDMTTGGDHKLLTSARAGPVLGCQR